MKLKYGHRGANQPVTDFESGRTFITSQNHGYAAVSYTHLDVYKRQVQYRSKDIFHKKERENYNE